MHRRVMPSKLSGIVWLAAVVATGGLTWFFYGDRSEFRGIAEAAKIVPLERLCLSPQCGFSSTEEGNVLTEDDQWAKIALVRRVAERVWGE